MTSLPDTIAPRTLKDLGIHYISVGHRLSILEYHTLVLDLKGQDQWRLMPVFEYKSIIEKTPDKR